MAMLNGQRVYLVSSNGMKPVDFGEQLAQGAIGSGTMEDEVFEVEDLLDYRPQR